MICHVCREQAVGQCKECLKFYCARHGDGVCVRCGEAIASAPKPPPDLDLRLPEYRPIERREEPGAAGPRCYKCSGVAVGACSKCGQFYCARHRGGSSFFDNTRQGWFQEGRVLCEDCLGSVNTSGMIGCVIALVIMAIMALFFFGNVMR
jgi:hypothetical protein